MIAANVCHSFPWLAHVYILTKPPLNNCCQVELCNKSRQKQAQICSGTICVMLRKQTAYTAVVLCHGSFLQLAISTVSLWQIVSVTRLWQQHFTHFRLPDDPCWILFLSSEDLRQHPCVKKKEGKRQKKKIKTNHMSQQGMMNAQCRFFNAGEVLESLYIHASCICIYL